MKVPSFKAQRALDKLGRDIATARRRRRFSQQRLADGASIGVATVRRLEAGDSGVAIGNLVMVLLALSETDRLADMLDIAKDNVGLLMEVERLPKRIRTPPRQVALSTSETNHMSDQQFDGSDL